MPPEADIALEIPLPLPARTYAPSRARYYLDTGVGRSYEDGAEVLPPFVPPGAWLGRKITGVDRLAYSGWIDSGGIYRFEKPAEDLALDATAFVETRTPPGQTIQPPPPLVVLRRGQAPPPAPPPRFVPDASRVAVLVVSPALSRVPPAQVLRIGASKPHVEFYPAPVNEDLVGLFAIEVMDPSMHGRYVVRRDGGALPPAPSSSSLWDSNGRPKAPPLEWWDRAFGERPVVFAPPQLRGSYTSMNPGELRELDTPALALVLDPHPWIPSDALPAGEGFVNVGTSYDFTSTTIQRFRQVRTRYLIVHTAKRHSARPRPDGGWIGHHVEHDSGNLLGKVLGALPGDVEKLTRTVIRSAAGQGVLLFFATVVSYGAGAPHVPAGLAAAGNAGVNAGGFVSAALPGASLSGSPVSGATAGVGSSPVALVGSPLNVVLELVGGKLPIAYDAAPVLAPEEVNRLLEEAAKGSAYLAGFDEFYGLVLREAIIQAQLTKSQRDKLRVELALIKIQVAKAGGKGLMIAQAVWKVVRAIVLTVGTAGFGEAAAETVEAAAQAAIEQTALRILDAAQRAVSYMTDFLEAYNERELLRIVEERIQARNLAAIAELEHALDVLETNASAQNTIAGYAPTPASAPSTAPSALQRLWNWLLAMLRALVRLFERTE